jgi:hypothetical protein
MYPPPHMTCILLLSHVADLLRNAPADNGDQPPSGRHARRNTAHRRPNTRPHIWDKSAAAMPESGTVPGGCHPL